MEVLPLMDTDRSGKISMKDFMNLMEGVFDRLDEDKRQRSQSGGSASKTVARLIRE